MTSELRVVPVVDATAEAAEPAEPSAWHALDELGGGRWEADPAMVRVERVSPGLERLLGIPAARWRETPGLWETRVHAADRDAAHRRRAAPTDHVCEYRILAEDGRLVWVREAVRFRRDASGKPTRLEGALLDITAEKHHEARVHAQTALSNVLAGGESLADAGPAALRAIADPLGYELAALWQTDPKDGILRCAATWRAPGLFAEEFEALTRSFTFAPGVGLPGRVLQSGRAAWVPDVTADENFPRAAVAHLAGIRCGIAIPIRRGVRNFGVIELFARDARPPDAALLSTLEGIGSQLAQFAERRSAESALRDISIRRGAILETALDGVVTIDAEGTVMEWNPAAERIFGWKRDEAIGRGMAELIVPPELREAHTRGLARQVATGESQVLGQRMELPAMRRDGTRFPAEIAIVRIPVEGPPLFTGHIRDITARRRDEAQLQESRAALAKAQEIAHLGSWTWDLASGRIEWSDELCRIHALPLGQRTDFDALLARVHPLDREEVATALERVLRATEPAEIEYRIVRADGVVRWVQSRAETYHDAEGAPSRIVGTCIDITDARRAQDALARLAAIVQDSEDAIYTKSIDGRITEWNPGAERLYGWTRDEILGKPIQTLVPPDRVEEEKSILARITAAERIPPFETERIRKDGTRFPVSISVSPLRNEAGRIVGASTVARDISERKQAERELAARAHALARMTEALARSNRELDQFAYITSHDLKAPLRGIANLSRWIEEDAAEKLGDESKQHLELLRGRVLRMEALIDAILEYSRVGRVRSAPTSVHVGELLREVVDLLSPPEGFVIEAKGELPTVVTERMRLQQVLMNLLSNGIKHHHRKESGRIVVSAEDAGDAWRFRVADDGPGIPARFHDKIFVLFQTLEPRDKVEGTGIGLALVKKIVEGYGGTISVLSEPGKGATFVFTWPKTIEGANPT